VFSSSVLLGKYRVFLFLPDIQAVAQCSYRRSASVASYAVSRGV